MVFLIEIKFLSTCQVFDAQKVENEFQVNFWCTNFALGLLGNRSQVLYSSSMFARNKNENH